MMELPVMAGFRLENVGRPGVGIGTASLQTHDHDFH
jgi:hypothetical protein